MPEDPLSAIPSDLSETESDPRVIEASFERQHQALKQKDKNQRKRDQKKRQRLRQQASSFTVVSPPENLQIQERILQSSWVSATPSSQPAQDDI